MRHVRCITLFALAVALAPARAETPIEAVVDRHVDAKLKADEVVPAAQAPDAAVIRRLTLDLNGRIPTLPEVTAYTQSTDPDKRAKLVDRLMASPAYARYQAYLFDAMLNEGN